MIKGLFCGVSKYNFNSQLEFCNNDAKVLAKAFIDNIEVDKENIKIATETGEISSFKYMRILKEFCEDTHKDDLIVVYFSGHGGVDESGKSILIATNSCNELTYIYIDQVIEVITNAAAKSSLVILDCCHSDTMYEENNSTIINIEEAIELFYGAGISILSSCKRDEKSYPDTDWKISAFTSFLCSALANNYGANKTLYLNELKNLIEIYAIGWGRRHPNMIQTPVLRSNTIGNITLPKRNYKEIVQVQPGICITTDEFDIINLKFDRKEHNKIEVKYYQAEIMMKRPINEDNIDEILSRVFSKIREVKLEAKNWRQQRVQFNPVEVIAIWIGNDKIDIEDRFWEYRAIWALNDKEYWINSLGANSMKSYEYSYIKEKQYNYLKKNRLENTYTDDEMLKFWDKKITLLVKRIEEIVRCYEGYERNEKIINHIIELSKRINIELINEFDIVADVPFTIPGSVIRELDKASMRLVGTIRGMIFLCCNIKDDMNENYKQRFKIELTNYYEDFKKWCEIKEKIEELNS